MQGDPILRRLEMYAMIMAIENDFIEHFISRIVFDDIPPQIIEKAQNNVPGLNISDLLHGLDLQSYIEIINHNIAKVGISLSEKQFLNNEFKAIIPIRNRIMHPRPLGFYDYSVLRTCFLALDQKIVSIKWINVNITRTIINETPEKLYNIGYNLRKSDKIIENLPTFADYEDTSFIGRKREIGELKERLYKKNVHILSIIGDGGIGKTAIALKLLYDILDDPSTEFELILWVSLKTCQLNNYEFTQIENAIGDISQMYLELANFTGNQKGITIPQYLINLSKEFKTLFVLDNLETINTDEIRDFLDQMSEDAKIIITSRIGLGEFEHRYYLNGLSDSDVIEYFNALLELYGYSDIFSNQEKIRIAQQELFSNPLTIKWFVRGLKEGNTYIDILKHKNDVINYCMSNVYEKLSSEAKDILRILIIANCELSYAEIMYYRDSLLYDVIIRNAINDLAKCNFVNKEMIKAGYVLMLNPLAKAFLRISDIGINETNAFRTKQKRLSAFKQKMQIDINTAPYAIRTFDVTDNNPSRCVAAFYLDHALTYSYLNKLDEAIKYVELAKQLVPSYFECNKVAAFIYIKTNPQKAIEEYEIALSNCASQIEKERILVLYAGFLLRSDDYSGALAKLEIAEGFNPTNTHIKFEKIKILSCVGDFAKADKIAESIDISNLQTIKDKNIFLTRKADILRRKAEQLEQRDFDLKFELIKNALEIIEKSEIPDKEIYDFIGKLLMSLVFICFNAKVVNFLVRKLSLYGNRLKVSKRYNELCQWVKQNYNTIPEYEEKDKLRGFIADGMPLNNLADDQGVICELRDTYGFVKNANYPQGIIFIKNKIGNQVGIGDIVSFTLKPQTSRPIAQLNNIVSSID